MNDLEIAEAMWTLGLLANEQLPEIACNALEAGLDSPSLRVLAGLTNADRYEAAGLFKKVLTELSRPRTLRENAMRVYIRFISSRIVSRKISPEVGARDIWNASIKGDLPHFHEADPFIYAISEREDRPQDREFFSNAIIEEARRWGESAPSS